MTSPTIDALPALYETDETAWLEAMAELIRERRLDDLDYPNLGEYLTDMALRERREVESRLIVLIAHLLKWDHQPRKRSRSWRATIIVQRQELELLLGRGVLRNHAEAVLANAYSKGLERAVAETGLPPESFPPRSPYDLDQWLSPDRLAGS